MRLKILTVILFFISTQLFAQNINISSYLKDIEAGRIDNAKRGLAELKSENKDAPAVLFLDAVLTEAGELALLKYKNIYEQHPRSSYADASLYRVFSFYYSLGIYNRAQTYLDKLKREYPASAYVKAANRSIPDFETDEPGIPVAEAVSTTPVEYRQSQYTMQAGAFLNSENANNLKKQFIENGHYAIITQKNVAGSLLNVVKVGRFNSIDEAKSALQNLSAEYKIKGRIINLTN